jgi:hypothetical protein
MSTESTKTAKNPKKNGKIRWNIAMTGTTHRRGVKLAKMERRSFSNFLEILIDQEHERQFPKGNDCPVAAAIKDGKAVGG